jgi:hypothetical protein
VIKLIGKKDQTGSGISYESTSTLYTSTAATNYGTASTYDSGFYYPVGYVKGTRASVDVNTWHIESTSSLYTSTATDAGSTSTIYGTGTWLAPSPREQKKAQIKRQLRTAPRLRGNPSFSDSLNPAEVKALQLLKSLVSPENFRRYLKYGFVTVEGMSGLLYNVYRRRNTIVFDDNIQVASLCVHLRGKQPPTDEVIAKVLMCECDEAAIWKRSNHSFNNKTPKIVQLGFDRKAA